MADSRRSVQRRAAQPNRSVQYNYNYDEIIVGNTVRQSAQPQWAPVEEPVTAPGEPVRAPKKRSGKRQRRALLRAKAFNLPSFLVVGVCMAAASLSLINYVGAKSELDNHIRNVKSLTSQLQSDTQLNDEKLLEIEASINYTDIYEYAISNLGMTFPGKDQILWYKSTESEYVSQYEAIPQE